MKNQFKVAFGDVKVGKKTTIAIEIKGDLTDSQKLSLLQFANSSGFVTLQTAQRDIDDYEEQPRAGIPYKIVDGVPEVDPNQLSFEDVVEDGTISKEEALKRLDASIPEDSAIADEQPQSEEEEAAPFVSVQVLKAFTYLGKKLKKNEIIQMIASDAAELDEHVKIVDSTLPF